jgi:hypothetical protein
MGTRGWILNIHKRGGRETIVPGKPCWQECGKRADDVTCSLCRKSRRAGARADGIRAPEAGEFLGVDIAEEAHSNDSVWRIEAVNATPRADVRTGIARKGHREAELWPGLMSRFNQHSWRFNQAFP